MRSDDAGVAEYLRVSTKGQQDAGFLRQKKSLLYLRKAKGLRRQARYTDVCSGKKKYRKGLKRLDQDIATGKVKVVAMDDLTRLARTKTILGFYLKKWVGKGVRIITLKEGLDTADSVKMIISSLGGYLVELKTSTLAETINDGPNNYTTGPAKYGLQRNKNTKKFEPNPEFFHVVRFIKKQKAIGKTKEEVFDEVRRKKFKAPQGGLLGKSTMSRVYDSSDYDEFLG